MKQRPLFDWRGLIPLSVLMAAWQLLQGPRSPFLPRPSEWWAGAVELANKTRLPEAIWATLLTIALGLLLATLIGLLLGLLLGSSRGARRALSPTLEFIRAIPAAAIVPIAVLLLGYDGRMKVAIVVLGVLWPILLNVTTAVARLHPLLTDVALSLRMGPVARVWKIMLPAILPALLLGVRVALPLAVVIALVIEMLTSVYGLGSLMINAQRDYHAGRVFALLVIVGAIGLILNLLLGKLEARLMRHRPVGRG